MRKLASIQEVTSIDPIPKADAIERLRILGWSVVARKGAFQVGDRVIYCEIDSLLPERPEFEHLRSSSFKPELVEAGEVVQPAGFRIKTVKLRGQVSQGICFPVSLLAEDQQLEIGQDVSAEMGIIKYEQPVPAGMGGAVKGAFPGFLPKTDEIRIQTAEHLLDEYAGMTFEMTEKLDGTSYTAFLHDNEFGICSRNQWIDETDPQNLLANVSGQLQLKEKLIQLSELTGRDVAIQGELIGPKIQKNKYKLKEYELYVFNLVDVGEYRLFDRQQQLELIEQVGLKHVPSLGEIPLNHTVDQIIDLSIGMSVLNRQTHREGIVFRPLQDQDDATIGGRLSFKAINPKFLLKYDE